MASASGVPSKADLQFRDDLHCFAVAQEPGFHLFGIIRALPCHGHARRKQPHPRLRQRKMAAERNSHAGASGSGDDIGNAQRRFLGALDLPGDTDLHIVDQQGSSIGREPVGERFGYRHWLDIPGNGDGVL
jgi:hypothetical protein